MFNNSFNSNDFNYCEVLTSKDEKFLRSCALSDDEEVRRDVALNENVNKKIVSILLKDESATVRRALAMNESVSALSLYALAQDDDELVRSNAIGNRKFPDSYLVMLAKSPRRDVKLSVAKKGYLPNAVLDVFSKDPDPAFRKLAARGNIFYHPSEKFCFDPDEDVRAAYARNDNASAKSLLILSRDKSLKVLRALSYNSAITKEIRHNLALSGDRDICFTISKDPLYPETCKVLYELNDLLINCSLSNNYSTPVEILEELAKSNDESIKKNAEFHLKRLENK